MELFRKQAWVEDPFLLGVVLGLLVIFSNLVGLIWRSKMGNFLESRKISGCLFSLLIQSNGLEGYSQKMQLEVPINKRFARAGIFY
jgi:hypothetical protein